MERVVLTPFACALLAVLAPAQVVVTESQELRGSGTSAGDQFGTSVAIDGLTAVVGAPLQDLPSRPDAGVAYVFEWSAAGWSETAMLVPEPLGFLDQFGGAVDIQGNFVVVGSRFDVTALGATGSVSVFAREGSGWTLEATLVPSDGQSGDEFGAAVSVWDGTILVGAPEHADGGAAYVYARVGTQWIETHRLTGDAGQSWHDFGAVVELEGDRAAIAAPGDSAAYVYDRTGTTWNETERLYALGPTESALSLEDNDLLGAAFGLRTYDGTSWSSVPLGGGSSERTRSVALHGDLALFGHDPEGHVLVFGRRPSGRWLRVHDLRAAEGVDVEGFGRSIGLFGERCVIGNPIDDAAGEDAGSVTFLRLRDLGVANELHRIGASDVSPEQSFGAACAISQDTFVVGAPRDDEVGFVAGAAYVFERVGLQWLETAKITVLSSVGLTFGQSIDVDQDTLVVGARGAAYVFERAGTLWSETAQLLSDEPSVDDGFGFAVSVCGDTVAVGAILDDEQGVDSGAAYVFERNGSGWARVGKLFPVDPEENARFGAPVDLDGGSLAVGARRATAPLFWSGAAYVFDRVDGAWTQQAKILPSTPAFQGEFGAFLSLSGDALAVSTPGYGEIQGPTGGVSVFRRDGATWTQEAFLLALDTLGSQGLGSVDLHGNRLCVGASGADGDEQDDGAAYVFERVEGEWTLRRKLEGDDTSPSGGLGAAVAISGRWVFCGAPADHFGASRTGSVFVFDLEQPLEAPSFCDGADGALSLCPCGNAGTPEAGCDLPQATGGVRLELLAQRFQPQNRATFRATGFPGGVTPAAVLLRSRDEVAPIVMGDGLRCVAAPLVRLAASSVVDGASQHDVGHGVLPGAFLYQLWFRSQPAMFCTPDAFNLSNGRVLTW